jgi:A/G-specific adenine glycosylase
VQVFAARGPEDSGLRRAIPAANRDLHWVLTSRLSTLPLTGLARKALQRLDVMAVNLPKLPVELVGSRAT